MDNFKLVPLEFDLDQPLVGLDDVGNLALNPATTSESDLLLEGNHDQTLLRNITPANVQAHDFIVQNR